MAAIRYYIILEKTLLPFFKKCISSYSQDSDQKHCSKVHKGIPGGMVCINLVV